MQFKDLFEDYSRVQHKTLSYRTWRGRISLIENHAIPQIGNKSIINIK